MKILDFYSGSIYSMKLFGLIFLFHLSFSQTILRHGLIYIYVRRYLAFSSFPYSSWRMTTGFHDWKIDIHLFIFLIFLNEYENIYLNLLEILNREISSFSFEELLKGHGYEISKILESAGNILDTINL